MEKFTAFRDKGTGISPFMPVPDPDNRNPIVRFVVRPVVFLLKLPFLLISTLFLVLVSPLGFLYKPLLRLYLTVFFNLSQLEFLVDGVKKSNHSVADRKRPANNDIVFVNLSSPLDSLILYLASRQNCVFYTVGSDGSLVEVGSPLSSFFFALQPPKPAKPANNLPANKAVFVFVEGTTTNNLSVMHFVQGFDIKKLVQANRSRKFKCLSIKVHPVSLACTPLPLSLFSFVYKNVSNFRFNLKYRLKLFEIPDPDKISEQSIRTSLSNYGQLKMLGEHITLERKRKFIESYSRTH